VGLLKKVRANLGRRYLRRNRKHRRQRFVCVEQTVVQMEIAWPATSGANCKISGQLRSSGRSEGGCFFVPHVYPFDLLVVVNGVDNGV